MKDFWQMIWQERVDKIVMVTQLIEGKVVTLYYSSLVIIFNSLAHLMEELVN
jgi:protein tyrosine phosphatase